MASRGTTTYMTANTACTGKAGKKAAKYYHYAGRFAAKEAIFKAVSTLLDDKFDISWQNAEVVNDENRKS